MSADLERVRANSVPDSSIKGIKPVIATMKGQHKTKDGRPRTCCICNTVPTQTATYSIQGAQVVERYCDSCIQKQFSRVDK
jgi:hypothetical protein